MITVKKTKTKQKKQEQRILTIYGLHNPIYKIYWSKTSVFFLSSQNFYNLSNANLNNIKDIGHKTYIFKDFKTFLVDKLDSKSKNKFA